MLNLVPHVFPTMNYKYKWMIVVKFNRFWFYATVLMLLGLREGHQTYLRSILNSIMPINICKFYGEPYKPSRSNLRGVAPGIKPLATFCFVSQLSNSHLQATILTKIKYRLLYPNRHEQRDLRCFLNSTFKTVKNNNHFWYDGKIDVGSKQ